MILAIIVLCLLTVAVWGVGGGVSPPLTTTATIMPSRQFRPLIVSHWKTYRGLNRGLDFCANVNTWIWGFESVCVQTGFPQRSHGFYSVSINHLHLGP